MDNGILFGWNVWRTLENGTPIALLPFLLGHVQKEHRSVILPVTQSIWKTGLLVIAGSMALLGVFRPARHGCGAGPALTVNGRNEPARWISGAV